MVSAGDFRNGVTFDMDGSVYQIIEFQHVKPGKGAAFVRTKIRNVITGAVTERTFNPTDKFPTAFVERKDMTYSYSDGDLYYFMDPSTSGSYTYLTEDEFILRWHDSLEGKSKRIGIEVSYLNPISEVPINVAYHID